MKVAITGGTGTLGRALIQRLLADGHERVVSLSRDEVKASELEHDFPDARVFLGDVRDRDRLPHAFRTCDVVIHAAALKRVQQGIYYPAEIIDTNITGTMNVVDAAVEAGVAKVLVISSDKAVHATNLYGATKFVAESYAVQANAFAAPRGTAIACTRYGNVLGSRGSVLEVWKDRDPLPLTDARMTRFVLSVREAVDFVLHAIAQMQGGEIFVPQLPAMQLIDLATAIYPDRAVRIIGLRAGGEKLHEQLISDEEESRLLRTRAEGTLIITPMFHPWGADPFAKADYIPAFVHGYRSDQVARLSVTELRNRCTHL